MLPSSGLRRGGISTGNLEAVGFAPYETSVLKYRTARFHNPPSTPKGGTTFITLTGY
jgi:hypothetical protein